MNISSADFADAMAFIGLQGQPPLFNLSCVGRRPQLSLAHLTSAPPFAKSFEQTFLAHRTFRERALSNPNVHAVLTAEDVSGKSGSMGLLFGLQHAPSDLTLLRVQQLRNAGIRSMALAYDVPTAYGDGFKGDGPLTSDGEDLVRWLGECGILLDISHAGNRTARGAQMLITKKGLPTKTMASHSGCYSVFPHPRNLVDGNIGRISRARGYIGVPLITFLITERREQRGEGEPYLEAFVRHITHILNECGDDTIVGIGSDCNHLNMTMDAAAQHFDNMKKMLKTDETFGEYFPDRPPSLIEHGSIMFEILEKYLLKEFSPALVQKLCGQNFKDFLIRSLPQA